MSMCDPSVDASTAGTAEGAAARGARSHCPEAGRPDSLPAPDRETLLVEYLLDKLAALER